MQLKSVTIWMMKVRWRCPTTPQQWSIRVQGSLGKLFDNAFGNHSPRRATLRSASYTDCPRRVWWSASHTRSLPPPPRDGRLLRYSTGQRAPAWLYTSYRVYQAAAGISNLPRPAPLARGEPISAIINQLVATPVEAGPDFQTPGSRFFARGPRRLGTDWLLPSALNRVVSANPIGGFIQITQSILTQDRDSGCHSHNHCEFD